MAIGSSAAGRAVASGSATVSGTPYSSRTRCRVRADGFGWSKASVAGSRSPVAVFSRLRSSTAVSESKPSSLKGRSATSCPDG